MFTILIMVGTSYAWWSSTAMQSGINEIQSDCLSIAIEDENEISLQNAYPLTDEEAEKLKPYTFTITNKCNTKVNYIVKLEKLKTKDQSDDKILKSEYVAIEVNGGQKQILSEYPTIESSYTEKEYESVEAKNIINGTLEGNGKRSYQLKLWMDEHVTLQDDATNKSFISKIIVEGGMNDIADYTEPILHGADPVLEGSSKPVAMLTANEVAEEPTTTDKLIPVIIDENGTVTKANIKEEWYNYEEKKWANAVILVDNSKEYKDGEEIPESNIESYFVWIPKYKYKIFDMGRYENASEQLDSEKQNKTIEINFDIEDTKDEEEGECKTPNESGADGNCEIGKWMTHPAFTAFPGSHGMWVGKFETGYKGATSTSDAQKNVSDSTNVIIKPNVFSWRNITVGNAFKTSLKYETTLESHLMKNTEWGAIAYLTQSIYGMCKIENKVTTCTEVTINSNTSYTTGYNTNQAYPNSKGSSTAGNNTGIFDMNGGAWEYMASIMADDTNSSSPLYSNSELNDQLTNKKYFDFYNYATTNKNWERRILGDATGELGPFQSANGYYVSSYFNDWGSFVYSTYPLFERGGRYGNNMQAGVFAFQYYTGAAVENCSYRIVLTP